MREKINANEKNNEKNSVKLIALKNTTVKIDAIDAVTNCNNTPFINFEGSIHRLSLNRFISEIEMLLLVKKPIIYTIAIHIK